VLWRLSVRALAGLLAAALAYLSFTMVQVWWTSYRDQRQPAEAIVVMGAAQYNGRPSPALQARLDRAVELHAAGLAPLVVVTGGQRPGDEFTEASAGQRYLLTRGIPLDVLRMEVQGRNSWESLAATARFLRKEHVREVLIVSDSYHSYRLTEIAREVGLTPHVVPARVGGASLRDLGRETVAVAVGRLLGYRRLTNLDRALATVPE